jgi:hypothetical protein
MRRLRILQLDFYKAAASTLQVVNALIKANKTFDLLVLPGQNHGDWGQDYDRKRADFFARELIGIHPPNWNTDSL